MSHRQLYMTEPLLAFGGVQRKYDEAEFVVVGVPFDSTSSYRPGSRFAPLKVREASLNIESNSLVGLQLFIEDTPLHDAGDLAVVHGNAEETLERLSLVVKDLIGDEKRILSIGGEHTITAGIAKGLAEAGIRPCLLVFDAHLDLRDEYLGYRFSHASSIRRAMEYLGPDKTVIVGARAYAREEIKYAAERGVEVIPPQTIVRMGARNIGALVASKLSDCEHVYVSLDIDALDPSYAPGTGTPEPLGLSVGEILRVLEETIDSRLVGADLVEVNPLVDPSGVTSIVAARLLQEIILLVYSKTMER
ncbi:MAG: agmatinase [Desulfurococcales archaeon]|nr:agmatinase [Desulfurococcales archaeon]